MINKFVTEEEYNKIVDIQEKKFSGSVYYQVNKTEKRIKECINLIFDEIPRLKKVVDSEFENKLMALINPYTRNLVKADLVEIKGV